MKLYVVKNKEGKFFRSIGYGGSGVNWVELEKAKFYAKKGQAASRVTFFFKNYPTYGCPEILEFDIDVNNAVVIDMQTLTESKIKKSIQAELKRQVAQKEYEKQHLEREKQKFQNRLDKLK